MRNPIGPRADGEYRVFGRIDPKTTEATFNNEDSGIGMGEDQGLFLSRFPASSVIEAISCVFPVPAGSSTEQGTAERTSAAIALFSLSGAPINPP